MKYNILRKISKTFRSRMPNVILIVVIKTLKDGSNFLIHARKNIKAFMFKRIG
jgi:hypothetical protein